MALVEKSVLVEYPVERMYALVENVAGYPEFLPWCGGTKVLSRDGDTIRAQVQIDFRGIHQRFTTENRAYPSRMIEMKLVEGPFRHLDGSWRFKPLGDQACKIEFALHYEFSSKLLEKLVGPVFNFIANTMVDAFVKRADALHDRER